jgi:hypothetical protein
MIDGQEAGPDLLLVSAWMRELAAHPLDAPAPTEPLRLFWKAQLLRRWDAEQLAMRPIEVAERVPTAAALAATAALAGWFYFFAGTLSAFR